MSFPKVQLKSKCLPFKQKEKYNIYPKGTFYKRTTVHISEYKTGSNLRRRSRPWIILLYFLPCLVIIKDLVPGIHSAARKENSEAGAMVSGDREIYDSWPGHYFYSFHRHALLSSQSRHVVAIVHPVTKIKKDVEKSATNKGHY